MPIGMPVGAILRFVGSASVALTMPMSKPVKLLCVSGSRLITLATVDCAVCTPVRKGKANSS